MVESQSLNSLAAGLSLGAHEHVALVGGGGKTTILHSLIQQLSGTRVGTCTTKMGQDQHGGLPVLLSPSRTDLLEAVVEGPVMVWKRIEGEKALGVEAVQCDEWFRYVDHVLVEADGSRHRPFKAPAEYEPVISSSTTLMLSVIGAEALGRVIADQCHRPLRVAALAECSPYERLTPSAAAKVLLHNRGVRKELPAAARFAVSITNVRPDNQTFVSELCHELSNHEPSLEIFVIGFE